MPRIPEAMDIFLDRYGILDANYEPAAQHDPHFQAVLLPDRTPDADPARRKCAGRRRFVAETLKPTAILLSGFFDVPRKSCSHRGT
jgi:hypothetical protein